MRIQPTSINFGITTKPAVKKFFAPNSWNEVSEGAFKDYSFIIYNNYQEGVKSSTLIVLKKLGIWVKSKLKYTLDGERKTLWSYANDKMVRI